MEEFKIPSFQSGINQYSAEGLIKPYEAIDAKNCNIETGSLKSFRKSVQYKTNNEDVPIHSLIPYYGSSNRLFYVSANKIKNVSNNDLLYTFDTDGANRVDSLNFEYNGKNVVIVTNGKDTPVMFDGSKWTKLKNRRPVYNDEGNKTGYVDANGNECANESSVQTYAPKGKFVELHYDRLWIAGDPSNPNRVYFSTNGVNGADIQDWTVPLADEEEINMHGGFLDVRSYDGSKIIGMKVVMNYITIFKEKSVWKVYGSSQENYQMIQVFSCDGAISDRSICVGNNGLFYLNKDGIYFFDGTNNTIISKPIQTTINNMNSSYATNSVGIYEKGKYYLAIPTGTSETNNTLIMYDTYTKAFMLYDISGIDDIKEFNDIIYYVSGKYIYRLGKGSDSLPMVWLTPKYDFGHKNTRKITDRIYFRGKGNGKVRFTLSSEKSSKTLEIELTPTEQLYRKRLKCKGRMLQLKIENINNSNIEIIAPSVSCELDED